MDVWDVIEWSGKVAPLAALVLSLLITGVLWRLGRVFASQTDVHTLRRDVLAWQADHKQAHADIAGRLDRGEARFANVESHLAYLPTARDLQDVRETMSALRAEMAAVRETHVWIREQVQLLVRHELNEGSDR
ncbi:DUF2730 family protein [uncultured Rhodospira sp.]|uniref:DUF2730 family protein n=1 Tax=uncultured Rhodospira sp. TaxID=1936189 RepID=UPI002621C6A1|nr:DUF2730 family protein [uncultured Rhodospira sp.]